LDKFTLPSGTIYEHAETVITQTWPAVNYNFPQIHVDKYDPEDDLWIGFEKIINNRVSGAFLINEVIGDETFNRNVMQPLPYLLHILQRGMIDGGYTLAGKILTDTRLQKACLFGDVDYYRGLIQEDIIISQVSEDATSTNYNNPQQIKARNFYANVILTNPGKYNISGTIKGMIFSKFYSYFTIKYRETVLIMHQSGPIKTPFVSRSKDFNIDIIFETTVDLNPNDITVEAYIAYSEEQQIINLTISAIRLNDMMGTSIPSVNNENKIDLTKALSKNSEVKPV